MTDDILNDADAKRLYRECLKFPELIDEISNYRVKVIYEIHRSMNQKRNNTILQLINANPDYNYPDEYLPDRIVEYWQEQYSGDNRAVNKFENKILKRLGKKKSAGVINNFSISDLNKTGRKMKVKGIENKPKREQIIKAACELINQSGKDIEYFLTKNGKANTRLYNSNKLRAFNNGNTRRWLDEAIELGEIQKK